MKENRKLMLIAAVLIIMAAGLGYSYGFADGVFWAVDIGLNFVEIEIDEEVLKAGILQYKNNIGGCFENASLRNDTWNKT